MGLSCIMVWPNTSINGISTEGIPKLGITTQVSYTSNPAFVYVNELIHILSVETKRKKEAKKENIMMSMNIIYFND